MPTLALALNENRRTLHADVKRLFDDPKAAGVATQTAVTVGNDRLEQCRHPVCHNIDWLFSGRRHPCDIKFPGLAMVDSEVVRGDILIGDG